MDIRGIDFTSAPSRRKPITCAHGTLQGEVLRFGRCDELSDFSRFEQLLATPGPWIAGIDFPFGQSRRLLANLGWPADWEAYVGRVSGMSRAAFVGALEDYKRDRPPGDREHRRVVDVLAGAISPQKLYGVPVAKMFYEGGPRLRASPASIEPVRRRSGNRVIVEAYPALVARRFIDRRSYKNDSRAKQTGALREARAAIVHGLDSAAFHRAFGFRLAFTPEFAARWIDDATGDQLDAVLCAAQAAWAWSRRESHYGMPADADTVEGWVADPGLQSAG